MNYAQMQSLCPVAEGQSYDWINCCDVFPQLIKLESTPQSLTYHAEGNVGIHTRMVLDALLESKHFQNAIGAQREVLFLSTLLHDICKPETTVIDPVTGHIGQPGHSRRGAIDVRALLWEVNAPFDVREAICRIIAAHQVPFLRSIHAVASRLSSLPENSHGALT